MLNHCYVTSKGHHPQWLGLPMCISIPCLPCRLSSTPQTSKPGLVVLFGWKSLNPLAFDWPFGGGLPCSGDIRHFFRWPSGQTLIRNTFLDFLETKEVDLADEDAHFAAASGSLLGQPPDSSQDKQTMDGFPCMNMDQVPFL